MEDLSELERVLAVVNKQLSGDEHDKRGDLGRRWLGIDGNYLVLDFLEGKADELLCDRGRALYLSRLPGHHRCVPVKRRKTITVGVELLVVELSELLGNGGGVRHCGGWRKKVEKVGFYNYYQSCTVHQAIALKAGTC